MRGLRVLGLVLPGIGVLPRPAIRIDHPAGRSLGPFGWIVRACFEMEVGRERALIADPRDDLPLRDVGAEADAEFL